MKFKIKNDVFNICNRLASHNRNYFIVFNTDSNKFELHSSAYKNTLCSVLPFNKLDARTINYVLKNERVDETLKEINSNNEKIEKRNRETLNDRTNYQFKEIFDYSHKFVKDFDGEGYKNKWI